MMVPSAMADSIRSSMGFPTPVSAQLTGWATGIIGELTGHGLVNNATGTITGTCAPGSPLSSGAGAGGLISGLSGSRMATSVEGSAGYPSVSSELSAFCAQIVLHIQTAGIVTFTSGGITGTCTDTPLSPGPLVGGAGSGGKISGLSGSVLASAIHGAAGYPGSVSTPLTNFCTAIVNYIMANASVSYASGSVTGLCPTGGGSLSAGTGVNGTMV
jgi:hypothetical protein